MGLSTPGTSIWAAWMPLPELVLPPPQRPLRQAGQVQLPPHRGPPRRAQRLLLLQQTAREPRLPHQAAKPHRLQQQAATRQQHPQLQAMQPDSPKGMPQANLALKRHKGSAATLRFLVKPSQSCRVKRLRMMAAATAVAGEKLKKGAMVRNRR